MKSYASFFSFFVSFSLFAEEFRRLDATTRPLKYRMVFFLRGYEFEDPKSVTNTTLASFKDKNEFLSSYYCNLLVDCQRDLNDGA